MDSSCQAHETVPNPVGFPRCIQKNGSGTSQVKNVEKYRIQYFNPPVITMNWAKKDHIEKAPAWCSVDLRDGNQALMVPMCLEEKKSYFQFLVKLGFKEIEVGFPAASDTEFAFLRALIEQDLIPEDVTIQVLTQAREHIIQKTFEALRGVRRAVVHLYNSTSVAQREQVFHKSKEEIIALAVDGAKMVMDYAARTPGDFRFEYSPESFTGTEMEFALEICNRVLEVWKPTPEKKGHYQSAGHCVPVHVPCLCQPGGVHLQRPCPQGQRHCVPPPSQRPGMCSV